MSNDDKVCLPITYVVRWKVMEFSPNGAELSLNSGNSENRSNHWRMNWVQYKDLLSYNCLCGTVVESLSFFLSLYSANLVKKFRENSNVNSGFPHFSSREIPWLFHHICYFSLTFCQRLKNANYNKKVLLPERKRHTARRVASPRYAVPAWEGRYPPC